MNVPTHVQRRVCRTTTGSSRSPSLMTPLPHDVGGSVGPVRTPRAGPSTTDDVSTITWPFSIEIGNRSIPRGAGPDRYSPITLYSLP